MMAHTRARDSPCRAGVLRRAHLKSARQMVACILLFLNIPHICALLLGSISRGRRGGGGRLPSGAQQAARLNAGWKRFSAAPLSLDLAMSNVTFGGIRMDGLGDPLAAIWETLGRNQVQQAIETITKLRNAEKAPVPSDVYDEVIRRSTRSKGQKKNASACRRALELYITDSMATTGAPPSAKTFLRVLQASSNAGDVQGAVDVLQLMVQHTPQHVTEYCFFLALKCCVDGRTMSLVEPILRQMDSMRVARSGHIYSILLKGYGRQRWRQKVNWVAEQLFKEASSPDLVALNSLIDALVRCGELDRAQGLLRQMATGTRNEAGRALPRPDVYTYNTLLRGMGQACDLEGAVALCEEMKKEGIQPDAVSINTLVAAATKTGKLGRAFWFLESSTVSASVEGYTALLDAFAARGRFNKANEVLKMMRNAGISPNVHTYTSLLKGSARHGDVDEMMHIFKAMVTQGDTDPSLRPTVFTYNTVMAFLIRGNRLTSALELLEDMVKRGIQPDTVTFNTLLDGLLLKSEVPDVRTAEELFVGMLQSGPLPDRYTFSIILKAYSALEQRQPPAVAQGQKGTIGPSPRVFGGPERLLELMMLRRDQQDVVFDTALANMVLLAFLKDGAYKRALEVFEAFKAGSLSMPAQSGVPDVRTYTILVKGIAESDNMYAGQKIMQLYREMRRRYSITPDSQLIHAFINSFGRARSRVGGMQLEDLDEVFDDLRDLGWSTDALAFMEKQAQAHMAFVSEAWKEESGRDRRRAPREDNSASAQIFRKYGWNAIESGFRQL